MSNINTRTLVGFETFQGVATVFVPMEVLAWRTPPTPAVIMSKFYLRNIKGWFYGGELENILPLDLFVDLAVSTFPTPPGSLPVSLGLALITDGRGWCWLGGGGGGGTKEQFHG